MDGASRDPARAVASRKAVALGVALALHAAVVVAWDLARPLEHGRALAASPMQATVTWLRLHPLSPPTQGPAADAPQAPADPALAAEAPLPDTPAAGAGAPDLPAGTLVHHGGSWSPGYPDVAIEQDEVRLVLALAFDEAGRVSTSEPVGTVTDEVLLQHIQDLLPQVQLAPADGRALRRACLELVFDARQAQVRWRLLACDASGAGRRP